MSLELEGRLTVFSCLRGHLTAVLSAFFTSTCDTWTVGLFTVALRVRLSGGAVATVRSVIKTRE